MVVAAHRRLALITLALAGRCLRRRQFVRRRRRPAAADTIVGAGASFPYPLYSKWGEEYAGTGGAKLNYQSIGSGGGISAIKAKTVDFGASDAR